MTKLKKDNIKPIRIEIRDAHEKDRTMYYTYTSGDTMTACWEFYCTVPDLITRIVKEMPNERRYEFESTTSDLTVDEGRAISAVIDFKNTIYRARRSLEEIFEERK